MDEDLALGAPALGAEVELARVGKDSQLLAHVVDPLVHLAQKCLVPRDALLAAVHSPGILRPRFTELIANGAELSEPLLDLRAGHADRLRQLIAPAAEMRQDAMARSEQLPQALASWLIPRVG
jgi:hypothetical protein